MDTIECIFKRRSVRKFKEDKIDEQIIQKLLECGMAGPSAVNKRPWEFYVINTEEGLKRVKKASLFSKFDAPLAIIVAGNKLRSLTIKNNDFWIQDCSAAIENILLAATSLGLGTVWCGLYPMDGAAKRVRKAFNIPSHIVPLGLIYIGYPDQFPEARTQYDENRVHYIKDSDLK